MAISIALAGNPNCGKTTMFNNLTGSNQYVGNWPGVTVEKKEGQLKNAPEVVIQDLPGVYSLSPYTQEEVVTRVYLVKEKPDAILNIVDATNIERNLYLTTQLAELGIPMVIAMNMIDLTRKNGDTFDLAKLSKMLRCPVLETSALKGEGSVDVAMEAVSLVKEHVPMAHPHVFAGCVEHALAHIEDLITHDDGTSAVHHHHADGSIHEGSIVDPQLSRWFAIKLFERDERVHEELNLPKGILDAVEKTIRECEEEMDDDAESIITNQRYEYIERIVSACVKKGKPAGTLSLSDKIDRVVTNRYLALPIFALLMWVVYYIAVSTVGTIATDFTNEVIIAQWIQAPIMAWLDSLHVAPWLVSLIGDGIIGGVGAVIGFLPQMVILFLMLSLLEDCGYMSRVAFIMDRIFRKFGLSGKSFIPIMVGMGCGVPGIMASRTIESEQDRKMTVITTTFIPCGAKLPIIAMIAGALFGGSSVVAVSAYLMGILAIIVSGVMLKKTKPFAGNPAPFVMELPTYHAPMPRNVLRTVWDRSWSFAKRAGTVILLASVIIWFLSGYGWAAQPAEEGDVVAAQQVTFGAVEDMDDSMLGVAGSVLSPVFEPLGFGNWQSTVATLMGLTAKEQVVSVFGVLYGVDEEAMKEESGTALSPIREAFDETSGGHGALAAYAFLMFNLLCAPCVAAMGAIRREMNNWKWTAFAIGYQCTFAYAVALMVFQLGLFAQSGVFGFWTGVAVAVLLLLLYMLLRPNKDRSKAIA